MHFSKRMPLIETSVDDLENLKKLWENNVNWAELLKEHLDHLKLWYFQFIFSLFELQHNQIVMGNSYEPSLDVYTFNVNYYFF